jgi:hypothetical protein
MNYKFKFKSYPAPKTEERFEISRAEAKTYLQILSDKKELHSGEQRFKEILVEAFQKPYWTKMSLKKKSK